MPIVIKTEAGYTRNADGTYSPFAAVGEKEIKDQLAEIEAKGVEQVGAVNAAGSTQASSVNSAGQTQVNAINAAGTSAVQAIEQKANSFTDYAQTQEKLGELKEDIDALSDSQKSMLIEQLRDEKVVVQLKPNRIYLRKIEFALPTVIDHFVIESNNHTPGQTFNIAVYNKDFSEVQIQSGKSTSGAVTTYGCESGNREWLGNRTEVAIPPVELVGTFYVAYKTINASSTIAAENSDGLTNSGFLTYYPQTFETLYDVPFSVSFGCHEKPTISGNKAVTVTKNTYRVLGIDAQNRLYGHNTSTGYICKSGDNGKTWTDFARIPAGAAPSYIVVDGDSAAYYQCGGKIYKISSLSSGATITDITPAKKHPFGATLTKSICIANGYLWYGEYTYSTAAPDGSYTAENANKINNPYVLRYKLSTGVWYISATITGARHIHDIIPDDNCLWVIVGDAGIHANVGVHKIPFSGIVDGSDNADTCIRWTGQYSQGYVGKVDVAGQEWYNVTARIGRINGVKCLIGGSDRPIANCVVTKLEDEVEGSATSFPQGFSYAGQPSTETTWNSIFDSNGWLYGITRETTTSKLTVTPPPYCSTYVIYDFGEVLQPYEVFYSPAIHVLWIKDMRIVLPYFNINSCNIVEKHTFKNRNDYAVLPDYSARVAFDAADYIHIKNGDQNSMTRRGIQTELFDASLYDSVIVEYRVEKVDKHGKTMEPRFHVHIEDSTGTQKREFNVMTLTPDMDRRIATLDISSVTGNCAVVACFATPGGGANLEVSGYIERVVAYPKLSLT